MRADSENSGLTHAEVLEILSYNPERGTFHWKKDGRHRRAGDRAGSFGKEGYYQVKIQYRNYRAGRLAWFYMTGKWPKDQIDHINGVKDDDRWCNLREATRYQNSWNRKSYKGKELPYKGVWTSPYTGEYWVSLMVNGKSIKRGPFRDPQIAHEAYKVLAVEHHGEFARFE